MPARIISGVTSNLSRTSNDVRERFRADPSARQHKMSSLHLYLAWYFRY
jgi:hypothetical protein